MSKGFIQYALAKYPRKSQPKEFLVDRMRFPLHPTVTTTDLGKARIWNEQSGGYAYMMRHPDVHKEFFVLPVQIAGVVTNPEKRALLGRPRPVRRLKSRAHAHA